MALIIVQDSTTIRIYISEHQFKKKVVAVPADFKDYYGFLVIECFVKHKLLLFGVSHLISAFIFPFPYESLYSLL